MAKVNRRITNHKAKLHKTEHFLPEQIERLQAGAPGQEKDIARFYFRNPDRQFGPCQVHKAFFPDAPVKQDWDIVSTRRAISNLTEDDILLMTNDLVPTYRKGTEHQWRWKRPEDFLQKIEQGELGFKAATKSKAYSI